MYPNDLTEPFEPTSEAIGTIPEQKNVPSAVKKSRTKLIVLVIVLLAGVWVSIPYIQFFVNFWVSIPQETKSIGAMVDDFLTAMANKETEKAYTMGTSQGDANTWQAGIDNLLQGNNFVLFEGYREISLTNINISQFGTEKYAEVQGDVMYEGDFIGTFSADVVKEGQLWKFRSVTVNAPAEKFARVK